MKNIFLLSSILISGFSYSMNESGKEIKVKIVSTAQFEASRQQRLEQIKKQQEIGRAKQEKYAPVKSRVKKDLKSIGVLDSPVFHHILLQRYIIAKDHEAAFVVLDSYQELRAGDPLAANLYNVYEGKIDMFHFDFPQNTEMKFELIVKFSLWLAQEGKNNQFLVNYYSHNDHFDDDLLPPEELTFSY